MPSPTGTVTFLFTDIEGSTKLWEQQPEAMSVALARHDTLLREAIMAQGGVVFKTMGDAYCAAFTTASQALTAAVVAQQAVQTEAWPQDVTLWVRMALHTGMAEERQGDYFGPPLNRIARLLGTGHGGQILLSQAVYELTQDTLPLDCVLQDLGTHGLRDLAHPEQVYQLLHPALQSYFPPLKSLDNPETPNNLPQQMTSFIGRENEQEQIKALLGKTRLVTLTGAGGAGKTRLSLQAAADLLDSYPDGVWLIELAPLTDPLLVPQAVANTLGVKDQPGQSLTLTLAEWLKPKHLLLILDNCEHLLGACATLADALLRAGPHVRILASSREAMAISGELTYRVPSLSLPDPKVAPTPETVSQCEAVRLFLARAEFVKQDFTVTSQNASSVASVCHRVDGIPLALELAAARVRSLSVEEINHRLDNSFRLLIGGSRAALPRQQTLRALIDWSYDLLTEQERSLLCRLSVFAGGWILEAAETVCIGPDIEEWEILDLLTSLVDKSLVSVEEKDGQSRYRLLETMRQYGRDKLKEIDDGPRIRDRHGAYFLALAEEAEPQMTGATQTRWLARLETEHDNFRAALAWFGDLKSDRGALFGLRLAGALQAFWSVRGYLGEGRRHFNEVLSAPGAQAKTVERANALQGAGNLTRLQGADLEAWTLYEQALEIRRETGDRKGIALSLLSLGNVAVARTEYAKARAFYDESLPLARAVGHSSGVANALANLGLVSLHEGHYDQARPLYEEALAISKANDNRLGCANMLANLGLLAQYEGDYPKARKIYEESLALRRELGHKSGIADILNNLGNIAHFQKDYAEARTRYEESLVIRREIGHKHGIAMSILNLGLLELDEKNLDRAHSLFIESLIGFRDLEHMDAIASCLEGIARLAVAQSSPVRAIRMWAAAGFLRESIGISLPPEEQEVEDRDMAVVRASMDSEAFARAWTEGRALTWQQAVAEALGE